MPFEKKYHKLFLKWRLWGFAWWNDICNIPKKKKKERTKCSSWKRSEGKICFQWTLFVRKMFPCFDVYLEKQEA